MKGKVALVTGGSSGIGLATAKAFARQGARVVIASRGKAAATAALKELASAGDATWQPVDVADGKSVTQLIARVMGSHGRLDYAFNNGGRCRRSAPVAQLAQEAAAFAIGTVLAVDGGYMA